jgi:hypothetical protein
MAQARHIVHAANTRNHDKGNHYVIDADWRCALLEGALHRG